MKGKSMPEHGEIDKLRVLIPHWIDHNNGHAQEFKTWSTKAGEAAQDIETAAARMEAANDALQEALIKLGGPIDIDPHPHD
ncbi:MAG: hypothetical protein PVH92_12990 [Anaerolineales bacterium]|jgi:hypothetical protein